MAKIPDPNPEADFVSWSRFVEQVVEAGLDKSQVWSGSVAVAAVRAQGQSMIECWRYDTSAVALAKLTLADKVVRRSFINCNLVDLGASDLNLHRDCQRSQRLPLLVTSCESSVKAARMLQFIVVQFKVLLRNT